MPPTREPNGPQAQQTQTPLNPRPPQLNGETLEGAHQPSPPPGTPTSANAAKKKNRNRANIVIGSLNMNGLTAPSHNMSFTEKWSMINQTLNKYKIAVLALQETHLDDETAERIRECYGKKMSIIHSADPGNPRATAGVAFVINKSLITPKKTSANALQSGRALMLEIEWLDTEKTKILNIYAPNDKTEHSAFWSDIETERNNRRLARPDFVLGDFNVTEDPIDRAPPHPDNANAIEALRGTKHAWELQDEWRQTYPDEKAFTYRANANGQQIQSRLDRIYVTRRAAPQTCDWKISPSPVPTDHWLVTTRYAPKDAPRIGKGRWTFPIQMLENKKLIKMIITRGIKLQTTLEDIKSQGIGRETTTPQRQWAEFKGFVQAATKGAMKETYHKTNSRIKALEKDRRETTNNPDFSTNGNLRSHEAYLANEIAHLEKKKGKEKKENLAAAIANHGEKLGGTWSAMSKDKKPRDLIKRLKVPNSDPPTYERDSKRMANLARNFHENLQDEGLEDLADPELRTNLILEEIPINQIIEEPDATALDRKLTNAHVAKALHLSKNGSATGLDGCPYELWKTLNARHNKAVKANQQSFDITQVLTEVLNDIQSHGVDPKTEFAQGWMCPIYKKKDVSEISNYRPITLLNTDYKILTKALAIQLTEHVGRLVHPDQAGFIPKRSIFDHIRLANAIINYAEVAEENGAIVALDQEKAYDKINHEYLWATLKAFNLPDFFINTVKALYQNAETKVAINGFMSEPYKIKRGIRQGDPLSCLLFDLGIEPLACLIRNDPNLKGFTVPGVDEPIKANFFADDTILFLSREDSFDYVQATLNDWCQVSGAKFNIEKTEIIPIGTREHRSRITTTRKINPTDREPLCERIRIAEDGEAVRSLGAWIGNNANDSAPWEAILDRIKSKLEKWARSKPTMFGRKTVIQAIVGGLTQFLTMAQGMPKRIEDAITKMIRDYMWEDDSSPRIALDILQRPIEEGGLNLLDIRARNEAIKITWIKRYLDFSPNRPKWAKVMDLIIDTSAPLNTIPKARNNPFLQSWNPPTRGQRTKNLSNEAKRMIRTSRKFNANLAAIRITPTLRAQLPAWYHVAANARPITNAASKCLLERHNITKVADLLRISGRVRRNTVDSLHEPNPRCVCDDCIDDRLKGCRNPHACANEALTRINLIAPKYNPLQGENHDALSLTRSRKERNDAARTTDGEITFDPSITCKNYLSECFRIFTNPEKITNIPAKRLINHGATRRNQATTIYTDGACFNNGKLNARCGSGIWLGPEHPKNASLRVPGDDQSNQAGEIVAVIMAAEAIPASWPLKIITDSKYTINGLTTHLGEWEDGGWIGIKNRKLFRKAAYALKRRTAPTTFKWTKGHNGDIGNEESDRLAKEGAEKEEPGELNIEIPKDFDLQGAKLAALTQAKAYRGILERRSAYRRDTTKNNLQRAREAIELYNGQKETDASLWLGLQCPDIRPKVRQFLLKMMHETPKVGYYWTHVNDPDNRKTCRKCATIETMEHILVRCNESAVRIIWDLAKQTWPHHNIPWPEISIGIILGCGATTIPADRIINDATQRPPPHLRATARLMRILITESAHLIWVIRCERVIQGRNHTDREIAARWLHMINKRLTEDKIITTKIKRDTAAEQLVKHTWEEVLKTQGELPSRWLHQREFLVGRRV